MSGYERHTEGMNALSTPYRMEGVRLPVADVATSVAFYLRLGFTREPQVASSEAFALLRTSGGTLGLIRKTGEADKSVRDGIHIELQSDDLDGLYAECQRLGIEVESPPRDLPWERVMLIRDPDGFRVEFAQGIRGQNRPER